MSLFAARAGQAKPWKGAEMITQQTFKYGAFEGRILSSRGSGMITPFFLYKDGSEVPGAEWEELDFEMFGKNGLYQTQIMTPGVNGTQRTEHVVVFSLPTPCWAHYYTYRMEWTPNYVAFYVDGQLVRKETDPVEFAKLLDPARTEPMRLRVSMWAGDFDWSGSFDPTAVPTATYTNWIQAYAYTPGRGPGGSDFTLLWRDDLNSVDGSRWYFANWTFDVAVNDYVPQNATTINGTLVEALTSEASSGTFPATIPLDDGSIAVAQPPPQVAPVALPARIEAEAFARFQDSTPGNAGDAVCGSTDVDVQITSDPNGGNCNVGWTAPGEWLEYDVTVAADATFDLTLRLASQMTAETLHVDIDGTDVTGPVTSPSAGWQAFQDAVVPGIAIAAGPHVLRVVFDSGLVNINYFVFALAGGQAPPPPPPVCTPTTTTYQAQNMSATTGGPIPGGWNVWSNGNVSTTHPFIGGTTRIRVNAAGQEAAGVWPHMIVSVGGQAIGDVFVNSTAFGPFDFTFTAAPGSQTISVAFDNDFLGNGEDRNLLVDSVEVDECFSGP